MIKTFACPKDARLPRSSSTQHSNVGNNFANITSKHKHEKYNTKSHDEVRALMNEVKELSSKTLVGINKVKHADDALTKLGVNPPKQQTMPLKMALGIREGKSKRQLKAVNRANESGVILSKDLLRKTDKNAGRKRSREERGNLDVKTKGGVFHLKRSRLPSSLLNHS
jgi:hypothetical protein